MSFVKGNVRVCKAKLFDGALEAAPSMPSLRALVFHSVHDAPVTHMRGTQIAHAAVPDPAPSPGAIHLGHEKGKVEALTSVKARIACALVAKLQAIQSDRIPAAGAFGDVVTAQLKMKPARVGAELPVYVEKARQLVDHVSEATGLSPGRRGDGVAVHRVARPCHLSSGRGYLLHQAGQLIADSGRSKPDDEG